MHDTTRSTPAGMAVSVTLPADESERFSSLALSLVLFLLITSFLTSYYLKVKRITAVHETIVGLFAGMFVWVMLRLGPLQPVREMLSFSNTIMLNVLLPPIILSSGYDLSQVRTSFGQTRTHIRLRQGQLTSVTGQIFPELWHYHRVCLFWYLHQCARYWVCVCSTT